MIWRFACPNIDQIYSIESLQSWIHRNSSIEPGQQILMTARGKPVKLQTLLTEKEIFLYDRRILSGSSVDSLNIPTPKAPTPGSYSPPPDSLTDGSSLEAWQSLFKGRRAWAIKLTDDSLQVVDKIQKLDVETSVVQRSAAIAVENIKQHLGNLRPKYESSKTWAGHTIEDQYFLLNSWKPLLTKFSSIPAVEDLGYCLQKPQAILQPKKLNNGNRHSQVTLHDVLNLAEIEKAGDTGRDVSRRFTKRVADLTNTFEKVVQDANDVIDSFSHGITLSDSDAGEQAIRLMEEIEVVAKKISADYEYVLGLSDTPKSVSQVSRTALLHARNFLPSLLQTNCEVDQLLSLTTERKNLAMSTAAEYMQRIAAIESKIAQVHSKLANLDIDNEDGQAFEVLNSVVRLPLVYSSLLVECVRRREWTEKMTTDSSSLVEEMATFKEEEARRRKKWVKDMEGTVNLESVDHLALEIEVSIQALKQKWPNVKREDVTKYLDSLTALGGFEDVLKEAKAFVRNLDAPTKQQTRRAKAFKNGSIHDAAFGSNSLLLRGDDDIMRVMKNDKSKLEDKLRSSESRIRKLEDLLHRQSQVSRPSNGNAFGINHGPSLERHGTSPATNYTTPLPKPQDSPSRRSSISSRRLSMHTDLEEKSMTQRVVSLEAELNVLQKELATKAKGEDDIKSQLQDVVSTNKDLLGNFEAQQSEFESERRSLEEDNSKLKLKLEEVEDELDRMLESRDHPDHNHVLVEELESVRNEAAVEVQKAHGQIEFLRSDNIMQLEKAKELEYQVEQQGDTNAELKSKANELSSRLQVQDAAQAEHHRALRAVLLQLSQDEHAPEELDSLVQIVETLVERSAGHLDKVKDDLAALRADKAALEGQVKKHKEEMYNLEERLGIEEIEVFTVREDLSEQRAQFSSLQTELQNEREKYGKLKSTFSEDETKFQLLHEQIVDGDVKIAELIERMTDYEMQIQDLDRQLIGKQGSLEDLHKVHDNLSAHLGTRATRAEDISMRLYSQHQSLVQLLEQLGLTIIKHDDTMIIQKTSRTASASTVLKDASTSMNRSLSGPLPPKSKSETITDTKSPQWANLVDPDIEARQFEEYIRDVSSFDMIAFSEAIIKRVKETDHTARKWQREARAYRDKSHRAQSEAHEKIAFRSFKEGDLALFLPTRNQATRPWAAFNVGAPHYFLREQDSHKLRTRDWLLARISRISERVVDLSKTINPSQNNINSDQKSLSDFDDENPFELSDGLRWYLLDAAEEKPGAPINIGLSKVTVASANVDAKGSIRMKKSLNGNNGATKTLTRSLDSRRSSSGSKKGVVILPPLLPGTLIGTGMAVEMETPVVEGGEQQSPITREENEIQDSKAVDHGKASPSKSSSLPIGEGSAALQGRGRISPEKPRMKTWDSLWSYDVSLSEGKR